MSAEQKNPTRKALYIAISSVFAGVVILLLAASCTLSWCWKNRDTNETKRAARKAASLQLREAKPEQVLVTLKRLVDEKSRHIWYLPAEERKQSKWKFWNIRWGDLPRVSVDYVGQLTEDQFIRFSGDGAQTPANVPLLKDLLAFSADLLKNPELSKSAAQALSERRLDGFFLSNDFAGAIALLEKEGLPNRTPAWAKATAAKLRAHKAMEAKDWQEACTQMLAFIDFMLSDEQKDFEDCDPTTGIVYSRDWVVARNYLRCSAFMKSAGDAAKSAAYRDLAGTFFKTALEKAKEDESSLKVLVQEMKDADFPVAPEAKPAETK